jgi:chemotaxis protein methyltransferase CheR
MQDLSDRDFSRFQRFIFDSAGITLSSAKRALVSGRLSKRLQHRELDSFSDYLKLLESGREAAEVQAAVDLLTTNETYFFREPKHFEWLRRAAIEASAEHRSQPFRVWSAASSSGEEAYSIAMVLADCLGDTGWEVLGSDISTRVLARARAGHYPQERATHIPPAYLKRFCLKGQGAQAGTLLVSRALRERVQFSQVNLNAELPRLGPFDIVFLRNVMIYFSPETKREVVRRVVGTLKRGGHFCIGHSESLHDISTDVKALLPSVYRKP